MKFQWYDPEAGAPIVSIAEYGLTFSGGALHALGKPEFIILGFDEQNRVIGVKPCDKNEPKKIPFISKQRGNYVRISNKDFIRFVRSKMPDDFKVDTKSTRYLSKWDQEDGILKVFLDQPLE
jgi:hypothetical protein